MAPNWRFRLVCQPQQSSTALITQVQRLCSWFPSQPQAAAWTDSPAVPSVTCSFVQWERVSPTSVRRCFPQSSSARERLSADAKATTCTSKTTQEWSWTPRAKWRDQPSLAPSPRSALSSGPESPPTQAPSSERQTDVDPRGGCSNQRWAKRVSELSKMLNQSSLKQRFII